MTPAPNRHNPQPGPRSPILKICGITCLEDARWAVKCGANALGFVFYPPSPRCLPSSRAARIMGALPPSCLKVGVFVGSPETPPAGALDVLQLHGLESEQDICDFGKKVWIAVEPGDIGSFPNYDLIVDSSRGHGIKANWGSLRSVQRPFILSGGLTPENVGAAIQTVNPIGVDVSSGVEKSPGRKDPRRIELFLHNARENLSRYDSTGEK